MVQHLLNTVQELRDLFLEMFCATRTAVNDPLMQPSGMAQRRSFLVLEEGEIDGTTGCRAEDEDDDTAPRQKPVTLEHYGIDISGNETGSILRELKKCFKDDYLGDWAGFTISVFQHSPKVDI